MILRIFLSAILGALASIAGLALADTFPPPWSGIGYLICGGGMFVFGFGVAYYWLDPDLSGIGW